MAVLPLNTSLMRDRPFLPQHSNAKTASVLPSSLPLKHAHRELEFGDRGWRQDQWEEGGGQLGTGRTCGRTSGAGCSGDSEGVEKQEEQSEDRKGTARG